ncbi:NACHT domain-containing protein [Actinomadura sp. NAK00032]|uniref:NACHT and WD40 repeat domain-containing protein n=1 Tax=Actinomadura sp. NAK00032 TaxID=2742128 RepID=UPI00159122BD|nr:WD40 repeat domain-containing protein [Actinomadura sp. NAK00032]QKW37316.1 NACHT domain-containing protein [Actinomadura sp. NAK00032]
MSFWRRRRTQWGLLTFLLVAPPCGAALLVGGKTTEVVTLFMGLAGLVVAVATYQQGQRTPELSPGQMADDLAMTLREQWLEEAAERGLRDDRVLPLSWTAADAGLGDPALFGRRGRRTRLRLDGRMEGGFGAAVRGLAAEYGDVRTDRRLVVLGAPGSGKSVLALLLALGLLETRGRDGGDRVPVLLPASTWDPVTESMDDWIARHLGVLFGDQRNARRLLSHGLILPIVDGLDEVSEQARRKAVDQINAAVRHDRPVVVTCRLAEFTDVIADGAAPLRRAAVVEVAPVATADVVDYLDHVRWPSGTDWAPVYGHLRSAPEDDVVSATLSTPLMVSLVCRIYRRRGGDPAELLTSADSRTGLEEFLIGRALEAAYLPPAPDSGTPPAEPSGPWDAATARRYLTFLAEYLHTYREREFVWWMVSRRLVSVWAGFIVAWTVGTVMMMVMGVLSPAFEDDSGGSGDFLAMSAVFSGVCAVLAMIVWYAGGTRMPGRLPRSWRGSGERLRKGFATGVTLTLLPSLPVLIGLALVNTFRSNWTAHTFDDYVTAVMAMFGLGAVIACAIAVQHWLDSPSSRSERSGPVEVLRRDRWSALVGAAVSGAVVASLSMAGLTAGAVLAWYTMSALSGWSGEPAPRVLLSATADGFESGLTTGQTVIFFGLLPGVVFAILVLLNRAWPRLALARLWLAAQGRFPLRMLEFLEDAVRRGVVRQAGPAYQFQHARLQEWLLNNSQGVAPRARAMPRRRWSALTVAGLAVVALISAPTADDTSMSTVPTGPYELAAISRNGDFIAFLRGDETIIVWDVARRKERYRVSMKDMGDVWATKLAVSPDGNMVAVDDGGGEAYLILDGHGKKKTVSAGSGPLVFGPRGDRVISASTLWKIGERGTEGGVSVGEGVVSFSEDGTRLATESNVLDVRTGRGILTEESVAAMGEALAAGTANVRRLLALSSDGRGLVGGYCMADVRGDIVIKIRRWDIGKAAHGKFELVPRGGEMDFPAGSVPPEGGGCPVEVAFRDSIMAYTSASRTDETNTINVRDLDDPVDIPPFTGHNGDIEALAIREGGSAAAAGPGSGGGRTLVSVGRDGTIRLWKIPRTARGPASPRPAEGRALRH